MLDPKSSPGEPFQIRMGWLPRSNELWTSAEDEGVAYVNFARLSKLPAIEWKSQILSLIDNITGFAGNRPLLANISPQFVNTEVSRHIEDGLTLAEIDELLDCLTIFISITHKYHKHAFIPEQLPRLDVTKYPSLVRVGNVEMRVVENYLRDPEKQKRALAAVVPALLDEGAMYAKGNPRSWCTADDVELNIRKLMTNAGFYVAADLDQAWRALEDWTTRYLLAIRRSHLASHPGAYLFNLATQQILWSRFQERFNYVQHPDAFQVYEQIKDKRVLFVSPLAHLAAEQYESGRLWRLYKTRAIPRFELTTLPAYVSTWPNRPHADWSETFAQLCRDVDNAAAQRPIDAFLCSCGCYGLPLCDYVREKHGAVTLYLGNVANAYFGVLQNATRDFLLQHQNTDAFVFSDLNRYKNMHLIDNGRYV